MLLFILLPILGYYMGYLSGKSQAPKVSQTNSSSQSTIPTPSPGLSSFPNSNSHISESLGITFKYPSGYRIKQYNETTADETNIQLYDPKFEEILPHLPLALKEKFNLTINKWPQQETDVFSLVQKIDTGRFAYNSIIYSNNNQTLQLANEEGYLLKGDGDVIFVKQGIYAGMDEENFADFLSTFVFNDQDQASWETYTNKEFGFSIKYPKPMPDQRSTECLTSTDQPGENTTVFCISTQLISLQINVLNLRSDQTFAQFTNSLHIEDSSHYSKTPITIADKTGIAIVGELNYGGNDAVYLPFKTDKILKIKWFGNYTRLNQVLSTLTFTE